MWCGKGKPMIIAAGARAPLQGLQADETGRFLA
jgi:hypothetical protein